jgi:DNA-binding MarR family transcriptional regulator
MNIIKKSLRLSRGDYYTKHLLIINHILPIQMTPKEAEVLAAFMSLEGDLADDPFSTTGRKIVRERVGISAGGLGNYLDQLKEKGFILEVDKVLSILSILIPEKKVQGYQFKLEEI